MATEIEPTQTDPVGDRVVDRYDLPTEGEPVLMLDTDPEGYTAEWHTSWGLEKFEQVVGYLHHNIYDNPAVASFEPDDRTGFSVAEDEFRTIKEQTEYPIDCTYLVIQSSEYDVAWESWEAENRYILRVPGTNSEVFENHFYNSTEADDVIPAGQRDKALEQARTLLAQINEEK